MITVGDTVRCHASVDYLVEQGILRDDAILLANLELSYIVSAIMKFRVGGNYVRIGPGSYKWWVPTKYVTVVGSKGASRLRWGHQ